jgi:hypothetical protein
LRLCKLRYGAHKVGQTLLFLVLCPCFVTFQVRVYNVMTFSMYPTQCRVYQFVELGWTTCNFFVWQINTNILSHQTFPVVKGNVKKDLKKYLICIIKSHNSLLSIDVTSGTYGTELLLDGQSVQLFYVLPYSFTCFLAFLSFLLILIDDPIESYKRAQEELVYEGKQTISSCLMHWETAWYKPISEEQFSVIVLVYSLCKKHS